MMVPTFIYRDFKENYKMRKGSLNPEIVRILSEKIGKSPGTIKKDVYTLKSKKHGKLPINTVAHLYALENRTSVFRKLSKDEKSKMPNVEITTPKITQKKPGKNTLKKITNFITYNTNNRFIKAHFAETNKAYTNGCYTATFILCRKILENLLTDIIIKKFPKSEETTEMFYNTSRGRKRDFSEILSNLKDKKSDFGTEKSLIDRIINRAEQFKDDANNKTHSWYHIVKSKTEIDNTNVQDIIQMISDLEKKLEK